MNLSLDDNSTSEHFNGKDENQVQEIILYMKQQLILCQIDILKHNLAQVNFQISQLNSEQDQ